jgi:3-hydroxyisobutyrate dehydrogenase
MNTVGLIGAGVMGQAAAEKIISSGHQLWVYDIASDSLKKAQRLNANIAASPSDVSEKADTVIMFLPGPENVEKCVLGERGLLETARPNLVIVDMSTVDPGTAVRMAEQVLKKGVGYLDAPVLGRPSSVGNWALPVGGRIEDLEASRQILSLLANNIFHIGPSGSGNKIKLLNQLMFGAINAITAEMMAVSKRVGIAPGVLYETIAASQAATVSNLFKELGRRISIEDYENPVFSVDLLTKDVRLAIQMAKDTMSPPLLSRSVEFLNELAQGHGLGTKDTSAMWKVFDNIWDTNDSRR